MLILNAPETAVFRRHVLEAHSGSHLLTNLRLKPQVYKEDVIFFHKIPAKTNFSD